MIRFSDETVIVVSSGNGGNGCIAFRREKYVPLGGPSGGDGGRGGDVIFCVKKNLRTLTHLHKMQHFKAKNGGDGEGSQRFGRDGEDAVIFVPPGTVLKDAETGEVLREWTVENEDERFVFLRGGNGGWGNVHFKSATNQSPRRANKGEPGETRRVKIELSVIADVGLVGFPNAGKSSLLNFWTNARPKIAPYPFTTKIPNLGVLRVNSERDIIIADIPGIIENAGEGRGLGTRFLKHISRTRLLIFLIDLADENYLTALETLRGELAKFSESLVQKPFIVVGNKLDLPEAEPHLQELRKKHPDLQILGMSIFARTGMDSVRRAVIQLVDSNSDGESRNSEKDFFSKKNEKQKNDFLSTRSVDSSQEEQFPGQQ